MPKDPNTLGVLRHDLSLYPMPLDVLGKERWTIFDPISGRYYRIERSDFEILSRLYEGQTKEGLKGDLEKIGVTLAPMQIETVIAFLKNEGLLLPVPGETERIAKSQLLAHQKQLPLRLLSGYLSFRIPLFSPDRFLERSLGLGRFFGNLWVLWPLAMLAVWGYLSLFLHLPRFKAAVWYSLTWKGALQYTLAVVVVKIFHELAHAYTAKLAGLRVRKMGVAIIFFFPRAYTDVTDTWRLAHRPTKMLIDAAGILLELIVGGLAALFWIRTVDGSTLNSICYFLCTVSVVNTLFINANPLLKYDGYYLLMDWVNIDNLMEEASIYSRAMLRQCLFGLPFVVPRVYPKRLAGFLVFFGIASFLYRIVLYTAILTLLYFTFIKSLAFVLILIELYILLWIPMKKEMTSLAHRKKEISKIRLAGLGLAGLLFLSLLFFPWPWPKYLPCEIKAQQNFVLYVRQSGYLQTLPPEDGAAVSKGALVLQQENPSLRHLLAKERLEYEKLRRERDQLQTSLSTLPEAQRKEKHLQNLRTILDEYERRMSLLQTFSPIAGVFCSYHSELKSGKWLASGEAMGEIFAPHKIRIYAYAQENDLPHLPLGASVEIALRGTLATFPGKIEAIHTIPASHVPAFSLLSPSGGSLQVLWEGASLSWLKPYFLIEIQPNTLLALPYVVGRTGTISLRASRSLGLGLLRKLFQILQKEF